MIAVSISPSIQSNPILLSLVGTGNMLLEAELHDYQGAKADWELVVGEDLRPRLKLVVSNGVPGIITLLLADFHSFETLKQQVREFCAGLSRPA